MVAVCGKCPVFSQYSCWFVEYIVYALCKKKNVMFVAVDGKDDCDIAKVPQCKWPVRVLSKGMLRLRFIQGDNKVSVHVMITIQKVTCNVQSVPRQSPDIY
jgi:hypothetical protein